MVAGIAAIIDGRGGERLATLRAGLEREFGLQADPGSAMPHLSFLVAEGFEATETQRILEDLVARERALAIPGFGPCLFGGPRPTLFVGLTRTPELSHLHERLAAAFRPTMAEFSPFYAPGRWVPHVSLAAEIEDPASVGEALGWLSSQDFSGPWHIDNLSFASVADGAISLHARHAFRA